MERWRGGGEGGSRAEEGECHTTKNSKGRHTVHNKTVRTLHSHVTSTKGVRGCPKFSCPPPGPHSCPPAHVIVLPPRFLHARVPKQVAGPPALAVPVAAQLPQRQLLQKVLGDGLARIQRCSCCCLRGGGPAAEVWERGIKGAGIKPETLIP